ncbi:MAG: GDSL-like Lipase/Acylhydrolase [Chloroflexi bacterium ADurb.Bin325]|nr:MAG: GDSL-like Lipase/Acylhydrolase [Chloroflexi bacterium ADurb.Bin325]
MAGLPKVLLVGDSISIGYLPFVTAALEGRCIVAHHEGNSGDSRNVLDHLDAWLAADADAAILHFNVGLHDLRRWHDGRGYQVPLAAYRENLGRIVARLKATGKPLIWATITPVVDERIAATVPDFVRHDADVRAYNAAARTIMDAHNIPVNDLYAVVAAAGIDETLCPDGTHMTEAGYRLLGQAVARAVRQELDSR